MSEPNFIAPIMILITDRRELQVQHANEHEPACRGCALAAFGMSGSVQVFGCLHDDLSTPADGRRPRSAKAGNRGRRSTTQCSGRYGDFAAAGMVEIVDWESRNCRARRLGRLWRTVGRAQRASRGSFAVAMRQG